ncbi:tRNA pseudouridine(38-40) synthase TruA [Saccharibacter sp. 17.LH.SD]|uniref:tRNA pseudouridine(38-40) synthase TruA n=1 Tax=Saccharibacter sp. 17.LH.SD TaxID=2689393 RepID=UPI0019284BDE|nr:tRNA pseudouridine(38-40) synthase TruA [Saccharibacter sp. 17.LH.SD]
MADDAPPGISRWAIRVEFDGRHYVGWQRQKSGLAVQQLIEEAARYIVNGRLVTSITSGRTDAGVHASGLVAHLDFPDDAPLTAKAVRDGINYHLKPHPVVILEAAAVPANWNARFSATWRRYRYSILNRPSRPTLHEGRVWHVRHGLDIERMQEAAQHLCGYHDFSSFRAAACQAKDALRTLDELSIRREGEMVFIETQARSFLHHQVRNMVGTLALVGGRRWHPDRVKTALEARNRSKAGPTAPPDGLCLIGVGYPNDPFRY